MFRSKIDYSKIFDNYIITVIYLLISYITRDTYREVTLFEELQLLKEFEKSENIMEEKVDEKSSEKSKILDKVIILIYTIRI